MNANDHVPMVNIMPFGFCKKGMPCMPVTPVAWVDVNKKHIIDGAPALTEDSKLACAHGGVITIVPLDAGSAEEGTMNEIMESAVEKIGLALKMAGAIADCIDVFSPGGLVKMAGKKGAAKKLKGGGNKGSGSNGGENKGEVSNRSVENGGGNSRGGASKPVLPEVKKAINSNLPHAVERSVERNVFDNSKQASDALKQLSEKITKEGFPSNAILDTAHLDRVLVPVGNNGLAVYQVAKNGTAKLKTILIAK